ncbi:MAG: terminase small subunit [Deferribacteraceae bacterium]|jgi:phage terminase small subunit|nr:terminase small subunit [Deferribacteraceae bacterium]
MSKKGLTLKQKKFVEVYCGNATEAAIQAGYSIKTARHAGFYNMTQPHIAEIIKNRTDKEILSIIANRLERQQFWTEIMNNPDADMKDRLKASELLGKSEGDFIYRHEITNKDWQPVINIRVVEANINKLDSKSTISNI